MMSEVMMDKERKRVGRNTGGGLTSPKNKFKAACMNPLPPFELMDGKSSNATPSASRNEMGIETVRTQDEN